MNVLLISQSIVNGGGGWGGGLRTDALGGSGEIWIISHPRLAMSGIAGSQSRRI